MYLPASMKDELQGDIIARLKKIEGQVRGLQAMVTGSRECDQILSQVRAV
jgi:CsoR family transcriptional regulator, copper-sensing transcriptional repressor